MLTKNQERYQKNRKEYIERARIRNENHIIILKKFLHDYLSNNPCVQCGESEIIMLDFDHVNREDKSFSITRAIRDKIRLERVKEEISKCQVLCVKCHRRKTAKESNFWKLQYNGDTDEIRTH